VIEADISVEPGIMYYFESIDNPGLIDYNIHQQTPLHLNYNAGLLNRVKIISGIAKLPAINRQILQRYPFTQPPTKKAVILIKVWLTVKKIIA
jgi:hypothetical protein